MRDKPHIRMRPYSRAVETERIREEINEALTFNAKLHGIKDRIDLYCAYCDDFQQAIPIGDYKDKDKVVANGYVCSVCGDSITKLL